MGSGSPHHASHLPERDRARADHHPLGRVDGGEVHAQEFGGVAAGEEAESEHQERHLVADPADPHDVGRYSGEASERSEGAPGDEERCSLAPLVTGPQALRGGDAGRPEPLRGERLAAEEPVEHGDVEERAQHRAEDHRGNQVRPAEEPHHPRREEDGIGASEGGGRDDRLQQVLARGAPEPPGDRERQPPHRDGDDRGDDRAVRGDPDPGQELHPDDGPEQREPGSEQQRPRLKETRMPPLAHLSKYAGAQESAAPFRRTALPGRERRSSDRHSPPQAGGTAYG